HRLLRQGRPEEVWGTLHHVWGNQASPGLYTWATSRAATDDVADGWQYARGWHDRTTVSPDYETAALLLCCSRTCWRISTPRSQIHLWSSAREFHRTGSRSRLLFRISCSPAVRSPGNGMATPC